MISVDYPHNWGNIKSMIDADLQGQIIASVYFFREVCRVYEYQIK